MKRDLRKLTTDTYDVLVIGGGIHGACVAWDAMLRGLSVALVEKGDFGSATSANSLKIVHGGLRYLQQADFVRMRESIRERATLMRIAPHLVHPLRCLMPTYGHGVKGDVGMALGLLINDLISYDRNRHVDPSRHLPGGRLISRRECLELLPGISEKGLSGGAVWYDGQMYSSERLTLSFVQSAAQVGADVANYAEVIGFVRRQDRITGVTVRDVLTGETFDVCARMVVNTSGPWLDRVLGLLDRRKAQMGVHLAKAMNLVVPQILKDYAVAVSARDNSSKSGAPGQSNPVLFITPWRGISLIGTRYTTYDDHPDNLQATTADIDSLLQEVNAAWPALGLQQSQVLAVHCGLVPVTPKDGQSTGFRRAGRYRIIDHREQGLAGLVSVLGVKYTTARDVAEKTVDRIFRSWGHQPPRSISATTPVFGGKIERLDTYLRDELARRPSGVGEESVRRLIHSYGTAYHDVLSYMKSETKIDQIGSSDLHVRGAEVMHGIHEEMAQTLADIVFRRTDVGTVGRPTAETIRIVASIAGSELGWSKDETERQIDEVSESLALATRNQQELVGSR